MPLGGGGLLIYFLGFGLAPLYLGLDLTTTPQWFETRFPPENWAGMGGAGPSTVEHWQVQGSRRGGFENMVKEWELITGELGEIG